MKKSFRIILLIVLALEHFACPNTQGQIAPTIFGNFTGTGVSNLWANSTSYTINSTPIELRKGGYLTFIPFVQGVPGSTNLVVFTFQVSADGSNWTTSTNMSTTSPGLTAPVALAASVATHAPFFVFYPDKLGGARYLRLGTLETANTNTVTNVRMQYSRFE
jgi:hypothetical protein